MFYKMTNIKINQKYRKLIIYTKIEFQKKAKKCSKNFSYSCIRTFTF